MPQIHRIGQAPTPQLQPRENSPAQAQIISRLASEHLAAFFYEPDVDLARVLNLQPVPLKIPVADPTEPILTSFWKNSLVPTTFSFTSEQERVLRDILAKWHLDLEVSLIDVLGLSLYDQIEKLSKHSQAEKEILVGFGSAMMQAYIFLVRTAPTMELHAGALNPAYGKVYYGTSESIASQFKALLAQVNTAIESKKNSIRNASLTNPTKHSLIKQVDEAKDYFQKVMGLFLLCWNSDYAEVLLTSKNLRSFVGAETQEELYSDSQTCLLRFTRYIRTLLGSLIEKPLIQFWVKKTGFQEIEGKLKKIEGQLQGKAEESLLSLPFRMASFESKMLKICNRFTHDIQSKKNPAEVAEAMQKSIIVAGLAANFFNDLQRILEFQVLALRFPQQYIPSQLILSRFYLNLLGLAALQIPRDDHHPFREYLHVEMVLSPFLYFFIAKHNLAGWALGMEGRTLTELEVPRELLKSLSSDIKLFAKLIQSLPQELNKLLTALEKILPQIPPEQRSQEFLSAICFEECLEFCRLTLFLRDAQELLGQTSMEGDIPLALADFIELEGIQPILEKFAQPQPMSLPEKVLLTSPPSPKEELQQVEASPRIEATAVPEEKQLPQQAEKAPEPFRLGTRNLRKVLQRLEQAGLRTFRNRGSHNIFKRQDGSGPPVVVPFHSGDLPIGTLKSIEQQAQRALESINLSEKAPSNS